MKIENFIENFKNQLEDVDTAIQPDTDFANAQYWDSLTAMVVKVMIEDDYGVDIQPEKISSFQSVQELFDFLFEKKQNIDESQH